MLWTVEVFVCCAIALKISSGEENIELDIAQGTLKGLKNITAYHGIPFYSFKGIPYAKPNVGRDKFNVAVPLDSWSGVLDATKHGNICPQLVDKKMAGDEDCLYLNVFTPDLNKDAKRAVMVLIHGGGFYAGDGNDVSGGPDYLVEKDIVFVSMNYRLGVIGFLNTGDVNAPGNIGLKDQNLVLKWVQKNIVNFGGCPNRVTIFGQSAGGASVHYHMLSPMSQGLFKGAILQSGVAVSPWAFTYSPKDDATTLANMLGVKFTNTAELVDKLKDKSAEELVMANKKMRNILDLEEVFVPSVEANVGQDVFLPDDPWKILLSGKISDVPVIIGTTGQETGLLVGGIVSMASVAVDPLFQFIPNDLNATDAVQKKSIAEKLSKFYFHGLPMILNPIGVANLVSDAAFNHASFICAEIMNARSSSPVYKYVFNYFSSRSITRKPIPLERGVVHCDDTIFLFYFPSKIDLPEPHSKDEQKTDEMVEMWTNFAKTGNPSSTMESAKVIWEPTNANNNYLNIEAELELRSNLWRSRIKFWAELYKNIIGDYVKLFN